MTKEWPQPAWWTQLPKVPGEFRRNVPLAELTTIGVGGPAEGYVKLNDWASVRTFVRGWHALPALREVALTYVGAGSNTIVRDGGLAGVVLQLGAGCDTVKADAAKQTIYAEAGASCGKVARQGREAGLSGVAFFGGIPGNVGGALRMNAGAYGGETYQTLTRLWLIDPEGNEVEQTPDFVKPGYRHTELPSGWLYKAAEWQLEAGDKEKIRQQMRDINHARSATQPLNLPSSGSWFKNLNCGPADWPALAAKMHLPATFAGHEKAMAGQPLPSPQPGIRLRPDGAVQLSAWRMLDAAGCRGLRVGGAQINELHPNFFVNIGLTEGADQSATARDFAELGDKARARVKQQLGVELTEEVRWIGVE